MSIYAGDPSAFHRHLSMGMLSGMNLAARPATNVGIGPMHPEDWPAVRDIYAAGIATGNATFETERPDWTRWDASHLADHRFVARRGGTVVGWVALAPVSDRCVYAGVAEDSVYVSPDALGEGVGRRLLETVIGSADAADIWTIQTGIFPENAVSIGLHQRCGFRIVGVRERLGRLDGSWRDVVFMERRRP
jgi:L-amino acid N-acyltransferase YncA